MAPATCLALVAAYIRTGIPGEQVTAIDCRDDAVANIVIAAAEVALALGIVVRTFRNRATANVDEINLLKW